MKSFTGYENMVMLDLSESKRLRLSERFEEIVAGFSELDAFDVSGVEPLVSVLDLHSILREDISSKSLSRDELLKNAPVQNDGYFEVPAAID